MTVDYFEQRAHAQGISHSYATIRRHGGLGAPLGFALGQWVRRTGSMASARIRTLASGADPVTRELESIKTATTAAFWRGYAFHRQEVVRDPALLAWVLRPDYFDTAMELG